MLFVFIVNMRVSLFNCSSFVILIIRIIIDYSFSVCKLPSLVGDSKA